MKRSLFVLVFALLLCGAPALLACETCYTPGQTDPAGNPVTGSARCWSGATTGYATCIPNTSSCTRTTDSQCTGGGGGVQHKDPVGYGIAPSGDRAADCSTDVSGKCSGKILQAEPFL